MSPSSDCRNDVKVSSLYDVQSSPVPANSHILITSTDAPVTLLNMITDTEACTINAQMSAVSSDSSEAVGSSSALIISHVDISRDLMSESTGRINIEDSDAVKKPPVNSDVDTALSHGDPRVLLACDTAVSHGDPGVLLACDTALSHDDRGVLLACDTQVPHVRSVDITSQTSADAMTVDS